MNEDILSKEIIQEISAKVAEQIAKNILCNQMHDVVESVQGDSLTFLDNCIGYAQTSLPQEEDLAMARQRMRICVGYNDDGSPIIKHISAENELALGDKAVRAILNSERRDSFIDALPEEKVVAPTFKEYAEYYFNTYKLPRIKPTTAGFYRTMLKGHFYPVWENTCIDQITTQDIQDFLNTRKDMAAKSLREMRTFLKAIFKSAVKDGYLRNNPADDDRIMIPSKKKTKRNALELEQVRGIIASLDKLKLQDRRYMALLLFTGMRRGEVLGLRWQDIDFEDAMIHVEQNVTYPEGQNAPNIGSTKTEAGAREIPLIPMLGELLKPIDAEGYIIGGESPITLSVHRRMMERIRKTINMHGATPHVFRHSFATMLNDAGASIKTIQDVIGDADFSTTANRYVHSRAESKRKAVEDVGRILAS